MEIDWWPFSLLWYFWKYTVSHRVQNHQTHVYVNIEEYAFSLQIWTCFIPLWHISLFWCMFMCIWKIYSFFLQIWTVFYNVMAGSYLFWSGHCSIHATGEWSCFDSSRWLMDGKCYRYYYNSLDVIENCWNDFSCSFLIQKVISSPWHNCNLLDSWSEGC